MAHQPLHIGSSPPPPDPEIDAADLTARPLNLDLKKDTALTIHWDDGRVSVYPVAHLRRLSPSAETRALREAQAQNPLTVLPASAVSDGPLTADNAELVGHYALRIKFSDGHDTGIYTWPYLREIDPARSGP